MTRKYMKPAFGDAAIELRDRKTWLQNAFDIPELQASQETAIETLISGNGLFILNIVIMFFF